MIVLRNFVAVGTQVKLEYPGKATAMALCDTIEGPIVELTDGSVIAVHDADRATAIVGRIRRIIDLGEILVPFGEFLENNRPLLPAAYSMDWHWAELEKAGAPVSVHPSYEEALEESHRYGVPLHPRELLFWHDLTAIEIAELSRYVESAGRLETGTLLLPWSTGPRELLVRLGFLFQPRGSSELTGEVSLTGALLGPLGLEARDGRIVRRAALEPIEGLPLEYASPARRGHGPGEGAGPDRGPSGAP